MKNIIDDAQIFYRNLNKSNMTMGDFVASERKESKTELSIAEALNCEIIDIFINEKELMQ